MRSTGALLGLLGVALAGPARADVPPPIPSYAYYGPIRHCDDGWALEAKAGEAMIVLPGLEAALRFGRHHLGVSRRTSGYSTVVDPAIIRPLDTLTVEGIVLTRYRVSSGAPSDSRVTYLHDRGAAGWSVEISSDLFDGSDRDRAVLTRVMLGERAQAACAAVPDALRTAAQRETPDAWLMREPRYRGPRTVCWAGVALDVGADEAVVLPWEQGMHRLALIAPVMEVGIAGDFRSGTDLVGALPAGVVGSLLPFVTHFTLATGSRHGMGSAFMRAGVPVTNRARLIANRDIRAIGPDPGPGLSFSFSRPLPDGERDALIGRVRAATPSDTCFDPDKP